MGRRGGGVKKNEKEQQMTTDPTPSKDQLESAPCLSNFSPEIARDLTNLASLGKKILEKTKSPRRSLRNKNVTSSQVRDIEVVIENIDVSDDEEQLGGQQGEQDNKGAANTSYPSENPCRNGTRSDMKSNRYKEMYITSQKKIQELKDEKVQLQIKLEVALAKLEGYEKGHDVYSKAIDKLKEVFLVSSLTKATEMALGLSSSQPVASKPGASKRKKAEN